MNTGILEIRPYQSADYEELQFVVKESHSLLRKVYSRKPQKVFPNISTVEENWIRLVVLRDERIVATVAYLTKQAEINFGSLGVLAAFRRRGITRSLVGYLATEARDKGIEFLTCETIEETGNVVIFERLGFKQTKRIVSDDFCGPHGEDRHEVYLSYQITTLDQ